MMDACKEVCNIKPRDIYRNEAKGENVSIPIKER